MNYLTAVLSAVLIWSLVGLGKFSGFNTPPEFGDFEAQRHWMEITQHLDIKEWYYYDFNWWRLDYPPLTAYHSLLCGLIGSKINPDWFALDTSRGMEVIGLKTYMRFTVILSQLICYLPFILYFKPTKFDLFFLLALPQLTIIDHGHFQYNSVMLGLAMGSMLLIMNKRFVLGSFVFVLALFFKQMSLYYAPVIFMAILGHCWGPATNCKLNFKLFLMVSLTVLITAGALLVPFVEFNQVYQPHLLQILNRVFPVFRGLWEDKVANLWCTLNYTVFKLKTRFSGEQLQLLALVATLLSIVPSCACAFVGKVRSWPWAFASCAWGFFLFSFQVHEKSVLIPLLPSVMGSLMLGDVDTVAMMHFVLNTAYFSYWPLLKREELHLQYFVLIALMNYLVYRRRLLQPTNWFHRLLVGVSYLVFASILAADCFDLVPAEFIKRYPDILVVLNITASFGCFSYYYLYATVKMVRLSI